MRNDGCNVTFRMVAGKSEQQAQAEQWLNKQGKKAARYGNRAKALSRVANDMQMFVEMEKRVPVKGKLLNIEHLAVFDDPASLFEFADWAKKAGYKMDAYGGSHDGTEFSLHFSHVGLVEVDDLCPRTCVLTTMASTYRGSYGAWKVKIVLPMPGGEEPTGLGKGPLH